MARPASQAGHPAGRQDASSWTALLVGVLFLALLIGKYPVGALDIFRIILSGAFGGESGVDAAAERVIWNVRLPRVRDLAASGMTMLVVTHEIGFAREAANRVAFLDGGLLIEEGPAEQVLGAPNQQRTREFLAAVLP